jgi:hypothetical protein
MDSNKQTNNCCALNSCLQNRRNLEFRYKAKLNTSSGGYTQMVQMQKNMNQNTPSMVRRQGSCSCCAGQYGTCCAAKSVYFSAAAHTRASRCVCCYAAPAEKARNHLTHITAKTLPHPFGRCVMCRHFSAAAYCQARIIAAERGIQLEGEEPIDPDRLLPGGLKSLVLRDWTLSPGVRLRTNSSSSSNEAGGSSSSSSSDGNLKYYVTLRKQPQVGAMPSAVCSPAPGVLSSCVCHLQRFTHNAQCTWGFRIRPIPFSYKQHHVAPCLLVNGVVIHHHHHHVTN